MTAIENSNPSTGWIGRLGFVTTIGLLALAVSVASALLGATDASAAPEKLNHWSSPAGST
jgi:hypothetical protein